MKKKIVITMGLLFFVFALMFSIKNDVIADKLGILNVVEPSAEASGCPNGCLDSLGDGCLCYEYYKYLEEKVWPID